MFSIISRVGLKFPWLGNHLPGRLINNKNTSPNRCFDQAFLYSVLCKIFKQGWRQITQSHDLRPTTQQFIPEYWPISAVNTALHRRFISTPRWAMSIFLLKSDDGTPQNMRFNVLVTRVCSIYGENNIWHPKSWRFTLAVEVVSQTALFHAGSLASLI